MSESRSRQLFDRLSIEEQQKILFQEMIRQVGDLGNYVIKSVVTLFGAGFIAVLIAMARGDGLQINLDAPELGLTTLLATVYFALLASVWWAARLHVQLAARLMVEMHETRTKNKLWTPQQLVANHEASQDVGFFDWLLFGGVPVPRGSVPVVRALKGFLLFGLGTPMIALAVVVLK